MKRSAVWLPMVGLGIFVAVTAGCGSTSHKAGSSSTNAAPSSTGAAPSSSSAMNTIVLGTWRNGVALGEASLGSDIISIQDAVNIQSNTELNSACDSVNTDVKTLQQDPSVPDSSINSLWQQALSHLARGATECSGAVVAQNVQEANIAQSDLVSGGNDLLTATERIRSELGEPGSPPDLNANLPSLSSTDSSALFSWWGGAPLSDESSVSVDLSDIPAAAEKEAQGGQPAWLAGCQVLATDIKILQHDPSPPVPAINSLWQQSLSLYLRGATECVAGTTPVPPDLNKLTASVNDIGNADNDMIEVTMEVLGS
jgi:hypothetical protein